jgi:hypothetical protein
MSTVKNPTFTFDLTQIQVVSFMTTRVGIGVIPLNMGKVVRKNKMDSYIVG